MDFRFTEEQDSIRRTVREFAETKIRPTVMEYDESQTFPLPIIKARVAVDPARLADPTVDLRTLAPAGA